MNETKINYSRWFFAEHEKPERIGVYEISALGKLEPLAYGQRWFAYWNGDRFTQACERPEYAANALNGSVFGWFFWRGLAQDPWHESGSI